MANCSKCGIEMVTEMCMGQYFRGIIDNSLNDNDVQVNNVKNIPELLVCSLCIYRGLTGHSAEWSHWMKDKLAKRGIEVV